MKNKGYIIFFLLLSIFIDSCDKITFESPQPIATKNIYKFPHEFIGVWNDEFDTVTFKETDVYWNEKRYNQSFSIKELDSISNYLMCNNKVYIIDKNADIILGQGFPYKLENDSIYFEYKSVNEISLSNVNFIRKINDKYLLNMKDKNQWFTLILFYINNDKQLIVRGLNQKDVEKLNQENIIYQLGQGESFQLFSNQEWSKTDLLKFINQGGFSDTLMHLPNHKKF